MILHQVTQSEQGQFTRPGQNAEECLVDKMLGAAFDVVEPGAGCLLRCDGDKPAEIHETLGRLHVAHAPGFRIPNFRAHPYLVEKCSHPRWIITEHVKAVVPLGKLDDHLNLRTCPTCRFKHDRWSQRYEQVSSVI